MVCGSCRVRAREEKESEHNQWAFRESCAFALECTREWKLSLFGECVSVFLNVCVCVFVSQVSGVFHLMFKSPRVRVQTTLSPSCFIFVYPFLCMCLNMYVFKLKIVCIYANELSSTSKRKIWNLKSAIILMRSDVNSSSVYLLSSKEMHTKLYRRSCYARLLH